jgi:hypothetical protein
MTFARVAEDRDSGVRSEGERGVALRSAGTVARVLTLQRSAGNRAVGLLLRQPVTAPKPPVVAKQPVVKLTGKDSADVVMPDGRHYFVTRERRPVVRTKRPSPVGAGWGHDSDRVYLKIEWCSGTKGEIQVGVNAPEVVKDVIQEISKGILNGSSPGAIETAVKNSEIKPSIKFDVARSGDWKVEGEVEIEVKGTAVEGGRGEIIVKRGEWDLALEIKNKDGSTTAGLKVKWTPGRKVPTHSCPKEHVWFGQETVFMARLESVTPGHWEKRTREEDRQKETTRFVYFDYAKAKIDEKRSAGELEQLRKDFGEGFRVSLVEGLTSPEGSHAPADGGRWQGNVKLAQERAKAALKRAEKECSSPNGCLAGSDGPIRDAVEAELYTIVRDGVDVEGKELEEHAVARFLDSDAETRHRTPEVLEALKRAKTPAERAKIIYPYLRRAEVHLTRMVKALVEYDEWIAEKREWGANEPAPKDVQDAVVPHFQANDIVQL